LVAQSYGGTKTQLALDDIRELWFPVPPVSEQTAIVEHVDAELSKIDQLRSAAKASIALLRERRSALIAAAVTGQLDVGSAA
jgi:type I restriction enzyme S subunit